MLRCLTVGIASAVLLAGACCAQQRTVAITVDDLPFVSGLPQPLTPADAQQAARVNESLLHALRRHHAPAVGFVIEQHVEQLGAPAGTAILKQWLAPGFDLGNHLYSHPDVNKLSVEQAEEEIRRGEASIVPLLRTVGRQPQFLRFPYNHTGDTREKHDAIAAFMTAQGYRLAPCTIDNSDYVFNRAYALALAARDKRAAARLRDAYVDFTAQEIDWYDALDRRVFGREIPAVMLLHDSPLNAATIGRILDLFVQRHYAFVSLSEAERDPAYAVPETYIIPYGWMWGYRWAKELNVKVNGRDEPEPPAWVAQYTKDHAPAP